MKWRRNSYRDEERGKVDGRGDSRRTECIKGKKGEAKGREADGQERKSEGRKRRPSGAAADIAHDSSSKSRPRGQHPSVNLSTPDVVPDAL